MVEKKRAVLRISAIETLLAERDAAVEIVGLKALPNNPLIREELQEMDGEPVWIESKTAQYGNYWITQVAGGIVSFRNGAGYGFRFEEVTDRWKSKIYRRRPEDGKQK